MPMYNLRTIMITVVMGLSTLAAIVLDIHVSDGIGAHTLAN